MYTSVGYVYAETNFWWGWCFKNKLNHVVKQYFEISELNFLYGASIRPREEFWSRIGMKNFLKFRIGPTC